MIGARSLPGFKRGFFDRDAVRRQLDPATEKVFSAFGAYVRQSAKGSIRYTKKATSKPGKPPRTHTRNGFATIKNILFAYDEARQSVIIGPVKLNLKQGLNSSILTSGTVPKALEHGGTIAVREVKGRRNGKWRRFDNRRTPRPGEQFRTRYASIAPRPFMGPAFTKEHKKLDRLWRNAL